MSALLVKILCERNIITEESILEARFPAKTLGETTYLLGEFIFEKLDSVDGVDFIQAFRPANQKHYRLLLNNIVKVDGMGLERISGIYGIKSDGSLKKQKIDPNTGLPVKRGRKSKRDREMVNVGSNTA